MNKISKGNVQESLDELYDIVVKQNECILELRCQSEEAVNKITRELQDNERKHNIEYRKLLEKWEEVGRKMTTPGQGEQLKTGGGCSLVDEIAEMRKEIVGTSKTTENRLIEEIASIREDVNEALNRGLGEGNGDGLGMEKRKGHTALEELLKFIELEIRQVKRAVAEVPPLSGTEGVDEESDDVQTGTLMQKVNRIYKILGKEVLRGGVDRDNSLEGEEHWHRVMEKLEEFSEKENENKKRLEDIWKIQDKWEHRHERQFMLLTDLTLRKDKSIEVAERVKAGQDEIWKETEERLVTISEKEDRIIREMEEMKESHEEMMEKNVKKLEMINDKKERIERVVEEIKVGQNEMMNESAKKLEVISGKEDRIVEEIEKMQVRQVERMDGSGTGDPNLAGVIAKVYEEVVEIKTKLSPTYAEVLTRPRVDGNPKKQTPPERGYSVIVGTKNEMDTAGNVEERIKGILEPRKTGLRIKAVRKVKGSKVLLTCASQEEVERVECLLKGNKDLVVERAKKKDPLVLLKNLQNYNTEEDIIESLKGQNAEMWTDLAEGEFRVSERYRRRARNQQESMVVLRVSPEMWTRMISAGKVHIDMQYVNVCDQSPLVQCTKCLRYGHGRRQCKEEADCCGHCGGPHLRADCPQYEAGAAPRCRNCGESADKQDAVHNALSGDCPTRIKWDALARASYQYCA